MLTEQQHEQRVWDLQERLSRCDEIDTSLADASYFEPLVIGRESVVGHLLYANSTCTFLEIMKTSLTAHAVHSTAVTERDFANAFQLYSKVRQEGTMYVDALRAAYVVDGVRGGAIEHLIDRQARWTVEVVGHAKAGAMWCALIVSDIADLEAREMDQEVAMRVCRQEDEVKYGRTVASLLYHVRRRIARLRRYLCGGRGGMA